MLAATRRGRLGESRRGARLLVCLQVADQLFALLVALEEVLDALAGARVVAADARRARRLARARSPSASCPRGACRRRRRSLLGAARRAPPATSTRPCSSIACATTSSSRTKPSPPYTTIARPSRPRAASCRGRRATEAPPLGERIREQLTADVGARAPRAARRRHRGARRRRHARHRPAARLLGDVDGADHAAAVSPRDLHQGAAASRRHRRRRHRRRAAVSVAAFVRCAPRRRHAARRRQRRGAAAQLRALRVFPDAHVRAPRRAQRARLAPGRGAHHQHRRRRPAGAVGVAPVLAASRARPLLRRD